MKEITKEEFFSQLNSCEYGRQYLELLNNPKNHLRKKDKGEVHHIHPKKMGGDLKAPENLVKLTIFNHCLAHVLLVKAGMQLHSNWIGEAKMMLMRLGAVEFRHLSEAEQITLEQVYHWSELRAEGHKESGRKTHECHEKMTQEEKIEYRNKKKEEANRPEVKEKQRKSQLKRFEDPNEHIKTSTSVKKAMAKITPEDKAEAIRKQKETRDGWSEEYKNDLSKRFSEIQTEIQNRIEVKESKSIKMTEKWTDDEYRNRVIPKFVEAQNRPEVKQHQHDAQIIAQNRPETSAKRKASLKYVCNLPENRAANSKRAKENQNRPEVKAKKSKSMKGKNLNKTYVNNGEESKLVTKEEAKYLISIGWKPGSLNSSIQGGSIYMTDGISKPKQVIPRKQQELFDKGWYRCHRNGTPW